MYENIRNLLKELPPDMQVTAKTPASDYLQKAIN